MLGSAESIPLAVFPFLAAGNFPNTLPENPENGFRHFPKACVVVRTRSLNRLTTRTLTAPAKSLSVRWPLTFQARKYLS